MDITQFLAMRLKETREEAGFTVDEAAGHCDLEPRVLAEIEAGDREPMLDEVRDLAMLYNVSMDYLAGTYDPGWYLHHTPDGEVVLRPKGPIKGKIIGRIVPGDSRARPANEGAGEEAADDTAEQQGESPTD